MIVIKMAVGVGRPDSAGNVGESELYSLWYPHSPLEFFEVHCLPTKAYVLSAKGLCRD